MNTIINKLGEKYPADSTFVADCRLLQSIYRAEIGEKIKPYNGRDGVHYYGNYIENGELSGANFLTDYTFDYAKERVRNKKKYETIESDRLFNNLLSSQPMAFNLFCPLRKMLGESPELATRAIRSALPMYPIHNVTDVDLEFIPENYMELTGDKSAMDAIIRYKDISGNEGFIAIETKYSENLGTNVASERGQARAKEIIRMLKCFRPDIEQRINDGKLKLTQIYRNFLLSESYGVMDNMDSCSIIMAPERHPSTAREVASLADELADEYKDKVCAVALEDFVRRLIESCTGEYRTVFERFADRYLNFDKIKVQEEPKST